MIDIVHPNSGDQSLGILNHIGVVEGHLAARHELIHGAVGLRVEVTADNQGGIAHAHQALDLRHQLEALNQLHIRVVRIPEEMAVAEIEGDGGVVYLGQSDGSTVHDIVHLQQMGDIAALQASVLLLHVIRQIHTLPA